MNTKSNVMNYIRTITHPNHKENLLLGKIQKFVQDQTQRILNQHLDLEVNFIGDTRDPRQTSIVLFNESLKLNDDWKISCYAKLDLTGAFSAHFLFIPMKDAEPKPKDTEASPLQSGENWRDAQSKQPAPYFYHEHDPKQLAAFHAFLTDMVGDNRGGIDPNVGYLAQQANYQVSYRFSPAELVVILS